MEPIKIVLVDDDEGICDSLAKILTKKGYYVDPFVSGFKALKSMEKASYDILITDLKMPEMNGIELLREARIINPELGVIIMTGFGEISSYLEAIDLGAAEYLNKPIKSRELELIIKKLTKGKEESLET